MIFLIEYDRNAGRIVKIEHFPDADREKAEDKRLSLELNLHPKSLDYEVVLLEAETEEALRTTHGRYFDEWPELIPSLCN